MVETVKVTNGQFLAKLYHYSRTKYINQKYPSPQLHLIEMDNNECNERQLLNRHKDCLGNIMKWPSVKEIGIHYYKDNLDENLPFHKFDPFNKM